MVMADKFDKKELLNWIETQPELQFIRDKANKTFVSFVPSPEKAREWSKDFGITMFFISSEHNWLRDTANAVADKVHEI